MALRLYLEEDFNLASVVDKVDTFTGNGSTSTFTLVNKTGASLGSTVQVEGTQYLQYTGGFTKSGNDVTLSAAPADGSQMVFPGVTAVTLSAFDQEGVSGLSTPREAEVAVWLGDISEIHQHKYINMPTDNGIKISITDLISSTGAETSWLQLASADSDGSAATYGATGASLELAGLYAFATMTASAAAAATSVIVDATSGGFQAGDYIIIAPGESNQEIRKVSSVVNSTTLGLSTSLDFTHSSGEYIFTCGRKFWVKLTIPLDGASNEAVNFYDIVLELLARVRAR